MTTKQEEALTEKADSYPQDPPPAYNYDNQYGGFSHQPSQGGPSQPPGQMYAPGPAPGQPGPAPGQMYAPGQPGPAPGQPGPAPGQMYTPGQTYVPVHTSQPGQMVYNQHMVIQNQPGVTLQAMPNDNLMYAIFTTLCCCWPIGIFAIMRALEVRNAVARGDMAGAEMSSRAARRLSHWALGVGIVWILLTVIAVILVNVLSAVHTNRYQ